jgi:hypothetical protein
MNSVTLYSMNENESNQACAAWGESNLYHGKPLAQAAGAPLMKPLTSA